MARAALSREELADLYRRRFKMVYQICLVLMKNVPDAEDAAQTVFRKALERAEPFRDPEHEKAWLIVTALTVKTPSMWWRRVLRPTISSWLSWSERTMRRPQACGK